MNDTFITWKITKKYIKIVRNLNTVKIYPTQFYIETSFGQTYVMPISR